MAEVAKAPRVGGTTQSDIAHIVEKYFPSDMSIETALDALKQKGFKTYPQTGKNVPPGQIWFIASRYESYRVILSEETRVILESDGKKILKSRGWIFLHGL